MEQYIFLGRILPERAQLSFEYGLKFKHIASGRPAQAKVNVILNQLVVYVDSEAEWDIHDLRNIVKSIISNELAMIGYLKGYAYDLEVTRVLNRSREIDRVFGIDIPCLAKQGESIELNSAMTKLHEKTVGALGVFLHRCFNDLAAAMKHADDTGFYCYRAIGSLRHHCAGFHGLSADDNATQWKKFREVSRNDEQTIFTIKDEQTIFTIKKAADPLRHGGVAGMTSDEREKLLTMTWEVVDRYLNSVPRQAPAAHEAAQECKVT
jgi:hypothetical protein